MTYEGRLLSSLSIALIIENSMGDVFQWEIE